MRKNDRHDAITFSSPFRVCVRAALRREGNAILFLTLFFRRSRFQMEHSDVIQRDATQSFVRANA